MAVRIRPLDPTNAAAWDAFVRARPEGSFFHLSAWARVIARSFGHPTHYALAEQDGAVVGVLPLVRMKTLLFGDLLASTPSQIHLARLLGLPVPEYAHVPLVLGPDGQRLAKRDGPVTLTELAAVGRDATAVRDELAASIGIGGLDDGDLDGLLDAFDPAALPREPWEWEAPPSR